MRIVHDTVSRLRIGPEITYRNLTMYALLDGQQSEPDYLVLDEALARRYVEVREVSEGGNVNDLRFTNISNFAVLLLDGEELVGAKQNRVLNLTILAPAMQTIIIPVACVEQGRWAYRSPGFQVHARLCMRWVEPKRRSKLPIQDEHQGCRVPTSQPYGIEVQMKMMRLKAHSRTAAMEDIYEKYETSLGSYERVFQPVEGQVGALFAINGRIVGFDLFDFEAILRQYFPKLLRSYALDAIDFQRESFEPLSPGAVEAFMGRVSNAHTASYAGVGEGEDVRLEASGLIGVALVARERIIHMSVFQTAGHHFTDENDEARVVSRLSRSSARA